MSAIRMRMLDIHEQMLETVRHLREMGALHISISDTSIACTFAEPYRKPVEITEKTRMVYQHSPEQGQEKTPEELAKEALRLEYEGIIP